ncbi:Rrf2 family transcriptional regulator [Arthrobacter alkaliphilus]|uniref:RrF2 family transcriptional regulator n=1 Tax=Arthrobacter alkaliphilus TaxID=369936 RepID=UPI001F2CFDC2|nr:Rrf2 family transcriptional regulator [Arthrobacter alkaliphilus]
MKINAFADVSLRAMMVLAAAPDGRLLTTRSIADAVGTPYNHVSKTMAKLRELGMIDVERGRNGGSRLSSAGRNATVGQLLRRLNTRQDPADCVGTASTCPLLTECRLRAALARAREAFYAEVDGLIIASLPTSRQMAPVFQAISLVPRTLDGGTNTSLSPFGPL